MWQYRSICYIELYTVTGGNILVCGSIGVYVILSCTQLQKSNILVCGSIGVYVILSCTQLQKVIFLCVAV